MTEQQRKKKKEYLGPEILGFHFHCVIAFPANQCGQWSLGLLFLHYTTWCCHSCNCTVLKGNKQHVAILHLQKNVDEQKHLVFISYSSGYFWCVISSDQHYKISKLHIRQNTLQYTTNRTEQCHDFVPEGLTVSGTLPIVPPLKKNGVLSTKKNLH